MEYLASIHRRGKMDVRMKGPQRNSRSVAEKLKHEEAAADVMIDDYQEVVRATNGDYACQPREVYLQDLQHSNPQPTYFEHAPHPWFVQRLRKTIQTIHLLRSLSSSFSARETSHSLLLPKFSLPDDDSLSCTDSKTRVSCFAT